MDVITRQRQIVQEHIAMECAHDWEGVVANFTSATPAIDHMPSNLRMDGLSGIAKAYGLFASALPDLRIRVENSFDLPGCSIREVIITGTHLGEYQGIKASGRSVRLACACFFLFDDQGRLATERVYFDNETLIRQMRGILDPYLPRRLQIAA